MGEVALNKEVILNRIAERGGRERGDLAMQSAALEFLGLVF